MDIIIHPFALCFILYLVARRNADFAISTVLYVTLGILLGSLLINYALAKYIGIYIMVPIILLSLYLLMQFCYVSWSQAIFVLSLFAGYLYLFYYLLAQGFISLFGQKNMMDVLALLIRK